MASACVKLSVQNAGYGCRILPHLASLSRENVCKTKIAAGLKRPQSRAFHASSQLNLRSFTPPAYNMVLYETLQAEGFKMPYAWPWETKPFNYWHFITERDPTVWKFHENYKVILVEGNIGVGKTRFCEEVARMFNLKFVREPEPNFIELLERGWDEGLYAHLLPDAAKPHRIEEFYQTPENQGRSGNFQLEKFRARMYTYMKELNHVLNTGQGIIMERSPYSDFVFLEAMAQAGYVSRAARQHYYEINQSALPDYRILKPHLVIYLDATVDTCLERIKQRGNPVELDTKVLTPTYLKRIEKEYKTLYLNSMRRHSVVKVYDWNEFPDFDLVGEDMEKIDFEQYFGTYGSVLKGYLSYENDYQWDQHRLEQNDWLQICTYGMNVANTLAPELWIHQDDAKIYNDLRYEVIKRNQSDYVEDYDLLTKVKKIFTFKRGDIFSRGLRHYG